MVSNSASDLKKYGHIEGYPLLLMGDHTVSNCIKFNTDKIFFNYHKLLIIYFTKIITK